MVVIEGILAVIVIGGAALLYFLAGEIIASAIVGVVGLAVGVVAFTDQISGKQQQKPAHDSKVFVDVGTSDNSRISGIDRPEGIGEGTDDVHVAVKEARNSEATGIKERKRNSPNRD